MTDNKKIFKSNFATAMDEGDHSRILFVKATPDFNPTFMYMGMTHLKDGTIYKIPLPLSAMHAHALRKNKKVSDFYYV
jgi:hypothetical protein